MDTSVYWVLGLVIAASAGVAYFVYLQVVMMATAKPRPAQPVARNAARARVPPRDPYRAVSVKPGLPACTTVKSLASQRFLVTGADMPRLPLEGCDCLHCACTYRKFPDRRRSHHDERRALGAINRSILEQRGLTERRCGRDRRAGERPAW